MSSPSPLSIEVRRIYDDPVGHRDEYRALVDRLWPRGVTKAAVNFDEWAKALAPSTELRRWDGWYRHVRERFGEFQDRYLAELRSDPAAGAVIRLLEAGASRSTLVLLTATRDVEHSGAIVLATHLRRRRPR